MYLTLALVILLGAIFVLFSKEFIQVVKKIFAIKGAKVVLPLFLASWFAYNFEPWCLWAVYYYREILLGIIGFFTGLFSSQSIAAPIITILLLTLISVVPVLLLEWITWRKSYQHYPYPYLTSSLIWIVSVVLLVVSL